jgi:sterol 3beta-glucosyltransferase
MRVLLTNFGTMGDIMPYLALAAELRRSGHTPLLAAPPLFAPLAGRHQIEFVPVGPDMQQTQHAINESMTARPDAVDSSGLMKDLFGPLALALPQMFEELRAACRGVDVLVSGRMQPASRMIHELTGVPFVSVQAEHFGGVGTAAFREAARALVNPFRASLGLPPLHDPITSDAKSPQLALYAMSRYVSPPPEHWPAHHHMTGYFFFRDESWRPDPRLVRFLAEGEPPVAFSFGSMTSQTAAQEQLRLLLEVAASTGQRAVIQSKEELLGGRALPPQVCVVGHCAHDWLFPQMRCVVHHGGAGTAAAVLRAGVPSVVVPHAWDQPFWAELLESLGCAGPSVPIGQLSAARLSASLRATLGAPGIALAAAALGEQIRQEQGVVKARQLIEQLAERLGLAQSDRAAPAADEQSAARRRQALDQQRARRRAALTFSDDAP